MIICKWKTHGHCYFFCQFWICISFTQPKYRKVFLLESNFRGIFIWQFCKLFLFRKSQGFQFINYLTMKLILCPVIFWLRGRKINLISFKCFGCTKKLWLMLGGTVSPEVARIRILFRVTHKHYFQIDLSIHFLISVSTLSWTWKMYISAPW